MYNQANNQLPVPHDSWDQQTLRHNLPQGNDVFPAVQPPPALNADMMAKIAGQFRYIAQSRLGRTPLHTVQYNLFAQQYFQNPLYTEWMQRCMDFCEFLMVVQHNVPDVAIDKAANKIYFASLAVTAGQYPQLFQMLDHQTQQALQAAGEEYRAIIADLQAFHQSGRRPVQQFNVGYQQPQQPMQQQYGGYAQPQQQAYGQLPPVTAAMQQRPMPGMIHNAAPGAYQPQQGIGPISQPSSIAITRPNSGGRYNDEPTVAQQPVVQSAPAQSWTATPAASPEVVRGMGQVSAPFVREETREQPITVVGKAPSSMDDIEVTPNPTPKDAKRPYDAIYLPGGVEVRPAHLSGWKLTRSDAQPYALGYDPEVFVLFHVKWPDGVVLEKVVEWETDMEYLKHELDDRLRAQGYKAQGKIVASGRKIVDMDDAASTVEEARSSIVDGKLDTRSIMARVVLEPTFTSSTDLENEEAARQHLIAELGLDESTEAVPAHEYRTMRVYPFDVSDECKDQLTALEELKVLPDVARSLKTMLRNGDLPIRYYRLLDQRLTRMFNEILADNLSMSQYSLDSFMDDIDDMFKHLIRKEGTSVVEVIDSHTPKLIRRFLSFAEIAHVADTEDEGRFAMYEEVINVQTNWLYAEIASLNLTDRPVLISRSTHPNVHEVVSETVKRVHSNAQTAGRQIRLITADGVYIDVLGGWLVSGALLLKKL